MNEDLIVTSGDHDYGSNDAEDNVSNRVVLQLEVGDVVSVQLRGKVWGDHRTTFSGFLLFALYDTTNANMRVYAGPKLCYFTK